MSKAKKDINQNFEMLKAQMQAKRKKAENQSEDKSPADDKKINTKVIDIKDNANEKKAPVINPLKETEAPANIAIKEEIKPVQEIPVIEEKKSLVNDVLEPTNTVIIKQSEPAEVIKEDYKKQSEQEAPQTEPIKYEDFTPSENPIDDSFEEEEPEIIAPVKEQKPKTQRKKRAQKPKKPEVIDYDDYEDEEDEEDYYQDDNDDDLISTNKDGSIKIKIKKQEKPEAPRRATYYLKQETIRKIEKVSKVSGIGKSKLVQLLLDQALDNLEIEK